MFDIQNVGGEEVIAACSFNYKSYVISMSTIFKPKSVCILRGGDFIKENLVSVQAAILEIDRLTDMTKLMENLAYKLDDGMSVIEYLSLAKPRLIDDIRKALEGM